MTALLSRLRATVERYPSVVDGVLASALLVGAAIGLTHDVGSELRQPDGVAYALTIAGLLPFYLRRRAPLAVLLVASIPVTVLLATDRSTSTLGAGMFLLAYTVAAWCDRTRTGVAVVLVAVILTVFRFRAPDRFDVAEVITNGVLFAGAFVFGRWAQARRQYIGWVEERARLLEREREQQTRFAVTEERLRIARELHDIVGHSLGVIAMQAGLGAHVLDRQPEQARRSLQVIADTSRGSLQEIRALVATLREPDDAPQLPPAPGLEQLDLLAERTRTAGVPVRLHVDGSVGALPRGVELAAYRIVQEALTNVLKHAPGADTTVSLRRGVDELVVTVDNAPTSTPPQARPAHGSGRGLIGMRERAHSWGGRLEAGDREGGGYRVVARLPVPTSGGHAYGADLAGVPT